MCKLLIKNTISSCQQFLKTLRGLMFLKQGVTGVWEILYCYQCVILNVYCDLSHYLLPPGWCIDTNQCMVTEAIAFVCKVILFHFLKRRYIWKITASNHYLIYFLQYCWYLFVAVVFFYLAGVQGIFPFLALRVALNFINRKTLFQISSVIFRNSNIITNKKPMRQVEPSSDLSFHGWYILPL